MNDKKMWSKEEDQLIRHLVTQQQISNWSEVAVRMGKSKATGERTGKQCRERWSNHLNPEINRGEWSIDEEKVMRAKLREIGNRWS